MATIVVGLLLLVAVLLAIRSVLRDHRKGGCTHGCSGCQLGGGSCGCSHHDH